MDVILFSQRLTRLLAGEEGTMLDGAKDHIQKLHAEIEFMISFLKEFDYKNIAFEILKHCSAFGLLNDTDDQYKDDEDEDGEDDEEETDEDEDDEVSLQQQRQSLMDVAITARKVDLIRQMIYFAHECEKAIDTCIINIMRHKTESYSKDLCDALHKLEGNINHIKLRVQAYNFASSSSSGTVERDVSIIGKPSMEGVQHKMEELLDVLIERELPSSLIAIVGSIDLENTTFVAEAYNSSYVKNYFDCHAWVSVTFAYNPNKLLDDIMKSVMPSSDLSESSEKDFEVKKTILCDYLRHKRYFIVLDEVWDVVWNDLRDALPDDNNGSRLLIKLNDIEIVNKFRLENGRGIWVDGVLPVTGPLRVRYEDQLFTIFYFGDKPLEKNKQNALLNLSRLQLNSYFDLPVHLKPCFVYFIVFHEGMEISSRHLFQLWIAEGFIQDNSEATAEKYLEQLMDRGFLRVMRRTSGGRIKTCYVPDIPRLLSIFAAMFIEFITSYDPNPNYESCETSKLHSIHGDPNKFVSSKCSGPNLRSLLCLVGRRDQPAPVDCNYISENFKLLRVLDLGALVLNRCPVRIENLLLLRYLKLNIPSLTSIPSSLCKLLNLYTLDLPSSLIDHTPDDIWKMKKLKHLNASLINLPAHPGKYISSMENLKFISTLHPSSCTRDILGRLPNLQSLRIYGNLSSYQYELSNNLCELLCVEYLKLVNHNKVPQLSSIVLGAYQFPPRLAHLSLSNTELKDDPMPALENLPHLRVLKLKQKSYSGRKLVCCSGGFRKLEVLHLKSMFWLDEWTMGAGAMPRLECLIINPCAYMRKLPEELWHIKTFQKFELWWPRPELKQRLRDFEDMERYDIQTYPSGL